MLIISADLGQMAWNEREFATVQATTFQDFVEIEHYLQKSDAKVTLVIRG